MKDKEIIAFIAKRVKDYLAMDARIRLGEVQGKLVTYDEMANDIAHLAFHTMREKGYGRIEKE